MYVTFSPPRTLNQRFHETVGSTHVDRTARPCERAARRATRPRRRTCGVHVRHARAVWTLVHRGGVPGHSAPSSHTGVMHETKGPAAAPRSCWFRACGGPGWLSPGGVDSGMRWPERPDACLARRRTLALNRKGACASSSMSFPKRWKRHQGNARTLVA
jgi:hypothetical protein